MRKFRLYSFLLLLFLILTACQTVSSEPVQIKENIDKCYTCHMGIEAIESASQVLLKDGTPRVFDDIGCMLVYLLQTNDDVEISFVKEYHSQNWINLQQSFFVQDRMNQTPMSYGFLAFETKEAADKFINEHGGEIFAGEQLLNYEIQKLKDWNDTHHEGQNLDHQDEAHQDGIQSH